ncbi:MAG: hypothetical protein QM530_03900 [Phycisphaerales bacterium]|nr:hypothetical protein [Phycisphaerales bacterium]
MRKLITILFISALVCVQACDSSNAHKTRGAIVFGDSATIVNEKDPQYLSDNVADFVPAKAEVSAKDTVTIPEKTTVEVTSSPKPISNNEIPKNSAKGLEVPFKGLTITISGIEVRNNKTIDWEKAKGVAYTIEKGNLANSSLTCKGATVNKVMQRIQTVVLLKTKSGKNIKLSGLPTYSTEWQTLKGNGGTYVLSGVSDNRLPYRQQFSLKAAKNAVQKASRANRMNRKEEELLLKSVNRLRAYNQAPLSIALKSVIWKISAKDAVGKPIEKEVRIDYER